MRHARPVRPQTRGTPATASATHSSSLAVLSDTKREGVWQVPTQHTAFSMLGGITLDLRDAVFEAPEVTIDAYAFLAGIDVIVNAETRVVVDGVGLLGDFSQAKDKVAPELTGDSPVVRVKGLALMAGVSIKRKGPPRARRKALPG